MLGTTSLLLSPLQGDPSKGDPLSPILFDIFINSCLQEAMPGDHDGVIIKGHNLMWCKGLMYADDVVTLNDGVESAQ